MLGNDELECDLLWAWPIENGWKLDKQLESNKILDFLLKLYIDPLIYTFNVDVENVQIQLSFGER